MPPAAAGPLPVETSPVPALGDRRLALFAALAAVYVIWGSTYLVMRIAVETLPPLLMGAVRFSIAGAILLVIAAARGAAWPTARQWLLALPVGALLFVGGNGLVAIAETGGQLGGGGAGVRDDAAVDGGVRGDRRRAPHRPRVAGRRRRHRRRRRAGVGRRAVGGAGGGGGPPPGRRWRGRWARCSPAACRWPPG
ncbi:MAG: EamA family transporter [Kofleriaceae bacterium]|nr:EamA family transporter [Kofleriaceae bacterium]